MRRPVITLPGRGFFDYVAAVVFGLIGACIGYFVWIMHAVGHYRDFGPPEESGFWDECFILSAPVGMVLGILFWIWLYRAMRNDNAGEERSTDPNRSSATS